MRFIFALPFAVLFLIVQWLVIGLDLPALSLKTCLWACVGAAAQTVATALMLAAMRDRSFVVSIAFTKIEPIIIAIFGILFLHETPSPGVAVAIFIATAGVMLMSWPRTTPDVEKSLRDWTPALMGISAGACFALSGTGYRGAILSLETPSFVLAATTTLALGLAIQTFAIVAWLAVADRKTLVSIMAIGARHCLRASWARWRRNSGFSASPSRQRRKCARLRWSKCCSRKSCQAASSSRHRCANMPAWR